MPSIKQKPENWFLNILWLVAVVGITGECLVKGDAPPIPHPCDNVKCPPLSELSCPSDSTIRELIAEPLIAVENEEEELFNNHHNSTEITEEIFSQCCLNKKCICKLCHIPDCHKEGEVVVELMPESTDMPGYCCGKYECQREPNCTEIQNTDNIWLTNCQRCKCYGGHSLCHQSCDEGIKKPTMCHSENSNTFYEHGQSWRNGCYDCECVNGETNCMITFCKGLNCPKSRQVQLKDSCCPVCWPKGFAMPNAEEEYDEEGEQDDHHDNEIEIGHRYDNSEDYTENEDQVEPDIELKPINEIGKTENSTTSSTTTTTTTTTTTSTTVKPTKAEPATAIPAEKIENSSTTATPANIVVPCKIDSATSTTPEPCSRQEVPATYQVYPQVVELMRYSQHNNLLYTIIGCLSVIVVILAAWNIHLKAKQRSYRPVSNFDDNFNRMSSNIKKMNDYV